MTAHGRRKQSERRKSELSVVDQLALAINVMSIRMRRPRWVYVTGIHAIVIAFLFVVLHLTSGGLPHH